MYKTGLALLLGVLCTFNTPALAGQAGFAQVTIRPRQLNWLGTDIPAGQLTFSLSSDSANVLMTDRTGATYPMIVHDPKLEARRAKIRAAAAKLRPDTLLQGVTDFSAAQLRSGRSKSQVAEDVARYLRHSAGVSQVTIDGNTVRYWRNGSERLMLITDPLALPSRSAQLMNYAQSTIQLLQAGHVVFIEFEARTWIVPPIHVRRIWEEVDALRAGEELPLGLVRPAVADLVKHPFNPQTLRPQMGD